MVAAQSGVAVRAGRGELIVVTDVEGHQVGDLWAVDAVDHGRWLSCGHTRDRIERLFPAVGRISVTSSVSRSFGWTVIPRRVCMTCCFRLATRRCTRPKV